MTLKDSRIGDTKVKPGAANPTKDIFQFGDFEANLYDFVSLAGAGGIVPSTSAAVVAASLTRIESTDMPSGVRRVTMAAHAAPKATSTCIGWLVAVNPGGQANAKLALDLAIDSNAGNLMSYGATVTPAAVSDNIVFVPSNGDLVTIDLLADLVDIFTVPIDSAATRVGIAYMAMNLGVPA